MTEFPHETVLFYAKDFFGIFLRNARVRFYQQERLVHEDRFRDGIVAVRVPDNVPPGVYDIETVREGDTGGNVSTYTVRDFVIPLVSHYYDHSQLHGDLKLSGGNLDPETTIEARKVDPLLYHRLRQLPEGTADTLGYIIDNTGNPDSIRWGGGVSLGTALNVESGEAVVGGHLYTWENTSFDLPDALGAYELGLKNGVLTLAPEVDFRFARVLREGYDWVRLEVERRYHPMRRGSDHLFFEGYERESSDVEITVASQEILSGDVYHDEVYGMAMKPGENSRVALTFHGTGPVIYTDRLYVYATLDYFLLFENNFLLVALPRFEGSNLSLSWTLDGLHFDSYGTDGHVRYEVIRPYLSSWVAFMTGPFVQETTTPLEHTIAGDEVIVADDWDLEEKTDTAMIMSTESNT